MRSETTRREGAGKNALLAALCLFLAAVTVTMFAACGDSAEDAARPATAGEELYRANCASCHGVDLRGTPLGPSHLSVVYEPDHHPDDAFRAAVRNGARQHHWNFGDMPAVAGLTDSDIDDIIAFVRSQQQWNGFEPYPP